MENNFKEGENIIKIIHKKLATECFPQISRSNNIAK